MQIHQSIQSGRRRFSCRCRLSILLLFPFTLFLIGAASETDLPVINGKRAVATVDGKPITLEEFNQALSESHGTYLPGMKAGSVDFSGIMNRLVITRLIVLEARNMGMHELPEFRATVDDYAEQAIMEVLLERQVKDVVEDEKEVERVYKEKTRKWKMKSFRFTKEEDIQEVERQIQSGADFDTVMKKAVEAGKAEGEMGGDEVKDRDLTSSMARLLSTMEPGETSPIVSLGKNGFIIFRLVDVVYPEAEDKALREEARREVRNRIRVDAARNYVEKLKKEHARVNRPLLEALDFEAKEPGFDQFLQDERVLAEIHGEAPIKVGDLAKALKDKFFHGMENAIRSKMVNRKKNEVFEGRLQKRVIYKEALQQEVDKDEGYRGRVRDYERSALFGAFVQKVLVPDIRVDESDLKKYYKNNREEFSTPKMLRIKEMVFAGKADAIDALRKLNQGTDFNWMLSHVEGQIDKDTKDILKFDGKPLSLRTLPDDLKKVLSDAKVGDSRLYESPAGQFYVLHVYHALDPTLRPYEQVREEVAGEVFNEKVNRTIEDWTDKLKEYYPVKIFAKNLKD